MRGDAEFCAPIHLVRPDLDLDGFAGWPDHRGVQALVHVVLRHRDIVLEPSGNRVPAGVDDAEGGIAFAHGFDKDADSDEIVDVRELVPAHNHLLVDRVVVLRAPRDGGVDPGLLELVLELLGDRGQILLTFGSSVCDETHDFVIDLGMEDLEGQVFEFPFDRVHAQPVCQRGEDVEGLAGFLRA